MQSFRKPQTCKSSGSKSPLRCAVFRSIFLFKHLFILTKELVVIKPLVSLELKWPFKGKEQTFSIVKDSLEITHQWHHPKKKEGKKTMAWSKEYFTRWLIGCVTQPAITVQLQLGNNDWPRPGISPGNETEENQQEQEQLVQVHSFCSGTSLACLHVYKSSFFSSEKYIHIKNVHPSLAPLNKKNKYQKHRVNLVCSPVLNDTAEFMINVLFVLRRIKFSRGSTMRHCIRFKYLSLPLSPSVCCLRS